MLSDWVGKHRKRKAGKLFYHLFDKSMFFIHKNLLLILSQFIEAYSNHEGNNLLELAIRASIDYNDSFILAVSISGEDSLRFSLAYTLHYI